ncbi:hypothetical protein [Parageobacillus thermoglucosidasius]|uniref:hypothetical protein n=1 Tax=Parageobacillus thermoglucosidasius TaxID=1426 RepID=UPI0001D17594|nr:hypothetical protein [Parageobacillus thermoglucosidasius]AEH48015.1 hypothetical protein Geoth_2080 [Parageobacillus thermoglucosidasius C56-YS93]GMO00533.1 hypothetical protein PthstB1num2_25720 [Parageobacillus thermoglucosidasius]
MAGNAKIKELKLTMKMKGLENDLSILFGEPIHHIGSVAGNEVTIKEAVIKGFSQSDNVDPNVVKFLIAIRNIC